MRRVMMLALALGGCAADPDPWPGLYSGTTTVTSRTCDGAALEPTSSARTVRIERGGDGGLFVSGRCFVELAELSDRSARVDSTECAVALDDGTPATVRIVGGDASLDGARLRLGYDAEVTTATACVTARTEFDGIRE